MWPYRGQSYQDKVPDTLDIAERARLAVHALPSITDPDADYEIYHWEGRYVSAGAAQPGEMMSLTFPLEERTVKEKIGPETYTLVIKGNTVVSIDPAGKNGPLYQGREKYRTREVAWRQVKRFVPEKEIVW